MDITFLLGNGFDIGLGLKTRYEDFYEEYCKDKEEDKPHIRAFKKELSIRNNDEKKKIRDWADFEKAFGEYSSEFKIEQKRDYLECFEDFVRCFNGYLEKESGRPDFSKEDEIGKMMEHAVTTYFNIREADREIIQRTYDNTGGVRKYNLISFNYTNCVDKCATALSKKIATNPSRELGEVIHVHGYSEANMIMGVNDSTQITQKEFAEDSEVLSELVKPVQNIEMRMNYDRDATRVINRSNVLCIYGMSIGDTDKKWWELICKWLAGGSSRVLVILAHNESISARYTFEYKRGRDNLVQRLISLSGQTENAGIEILKRIFVEFNHDVFAMKLCPVDNTMQTYASNVLPKGSDLQNIEKKINLQYAPEAAV